MENEYKEGDIVVCLPEPGASIEPIILGGTGYTPNLMFRVRYMNDHYVFRGNYDFSVTVNSIRHATEIEKKFYYNDFNTIYDKVWIEYKGYSIYISPYCYENYTDINILRFSETNMYFDKVWGFDNNNIELQTHEEVKDRVRKYLCNEYGIDSIDYNKISINRIDYNKISINRSEITYDDKILFNDTIGKSMYFSINDKTNKEMKENIITPFEEMERKYNAQIQCVNTNVTDNNINMKFVTLPKVDNLNFPIRKTLSKNEFYSSKYNLLRR